jgi:Flp pilus assembly protein TadD
MGQTERSARLDPASAGAGDYVKSCYAAGMEALGNGRWQDAARWAELCAAAPGAASDPRCASLAGWVAAADDDFAGAAAHFRRALELAPDDVRVARGLAEALAASGELPEAQAVLEDVARRSPDDEDVLVDLSFMRLLNGDGRGAREAIERAATLNPNDDKIVLAEARIHEALGEVALAAATSARVVGTTTSPAVLTDLARLFLAAGRYVEADRAFRRLQAIDPGHFVFAQHGRIWCQIKTGDWRGALELAIGAAQADRYEQTTALLAYAKDRLFTRVPDAEAASREAELGERFMAALREHAEQHRADGGDLPDVPIGIGEERGRG